MKTSVLNPNLKLFLIIVGAIIVALAAFTIGKSAWDNHEATAAQAEQQTKQAAIQQQNIASLQDLYKNKIGDPVQWNHQQAKDGFLLSTAVQDLRGDFQKRNWAMTVMDKPSSCYEVYSNQTQPMPGCDVQKADGTWTYSVSLDDAQKQLDDDVAKYNSLAMQVDRSALIANNLSYQLDENGNPID